MKNIAKLAALPTDLAGHYEQFREEICHRLDSFSDVAEADFFYELCYCLCTPQSKALNASKVVDYLRANNYIHCPFPLENVLRSPENYVRFHRVKSLNIELAREQWEDISRLIGDGLLSATEKRKWLVQNVRGLGMKESSHFLRNIGIFGLAILDRHILKHLVSCGLYAERPPLQTSKQYLAIEKHWFDYCERVGMALEEMDLLFWSKETGFVLK